MSANEKYSSCLPSGLHTAHRNIFDSVAQYSIAHTYIAGFHTEGWGPWNFPPPRSLEIEYGYYCGAINISYLIFTCYWT